MEAVTLFRFKCAYCQQPNEHREFHRKNVKPFLVSTKCASCQKQNWLGGMTGTAEEAASAPEQTQAPTRR
jgi:endogenous inhibitor of DNA gyrase (YacG/DUF329 family)